MASKKVDKGKAYDIIQSLNCGNKTAVTLVMELATRLGIPVEFEPTTSLKWTQDDFQCIAILGDITTNGEGKSKKEAKQNSAQKIIDFIAECRSSNTPPSVNYVPSPKYSTPSPNNSSGSDVNSGNAVGELQTLSAKRRWKLPEYEQLKPVGEPNSRTFTCIVKMMNDLSTSGKGSTKKAAKRQAAENMLEMLHGGDTDTVDAMYFSPPPFYNHSPISPLLDNSDLEDYSGDSDSPSSNLDNSTEVQEPVFDELSLAKLKSKSHEFNHEFFLLPDKSKKGLHQIFLKLTFNGSAKRPPVVTHGSGETEHIAKCRAAQRALKHLEYVIIL